MTDSAPRTFTEDFRRFFLRGLVVLLPSVLTLWIAIKAYQFIDNTIAEPINRGVRVTMLQFSRVWEPLQDAFPVPEERMDVERAALPAPMSPREEASARLRLRREVIGEWWARHWYMDLIGLFVAIIAVYIAGRLVGGFVGRRMYRRIEEVIAALPVFKQVYPYVKQVVDFLFSDDQPIKFNRVVAAEYPRKGIWSVGFLTGATLRTIEEKQGDLVTVFIPSSPTPFTGYTITIPRAELIELPLSVDEAIRFAVSGGVLIPEHQRVGAEPSAEENSGLIPLPGSKEPPAEKEGREAGARRRRAGQV